jgi:NTP pyrophosphatase (non-canonical NTP hydrolase)
MEQDDKEVVTTLYNLMYKVHMTAVSHGWWEAECNDGEKIALMHSELSEALEALRHNNPLSTSTPPFTNLEEELADVLIRVLDYAMYRDLRLPEAMLAKMQYNCNRPYKHGNKQF